MSVELVAGFADGETSAVLVEDLYLLIVEVVGAVGQFTCALEIRRCRLRERLGIKPYGRQAAVDHILTQRTQYLVVRVLPVLHGHHNVVIVHLGEAVEVER